MVTRINREEGRATLKPDEEKIVTYRVHYSW